MPTKQTDSPDRERDINADPLTGEPGSHPVGTGLGAASAGAAGAAIGSLAGPIGTAVGAVIGAVAGGYAGKGVAEAIDPTAEEAYWREHHREQPYAEDAAAYDDYLAAYRAGYTGYRRGETFEQREADLRLQYENGPQDREAGKVTVGNVPTQVSPAGSPSAEEKLRWEQARKAARAAYNRVDQGVVHPSEPR